jgi:hypothetical protein
METCDPKSLLTKLSFFGGIYCRKNRKRHWDKEPPAISAAALPVGQCLLIVYILTRKVAYHSRGGLYVPTTSPAA